jgi:hypothetical protein
LTPGDFLRALTDGTFGFETLDEINLTPKSSSTGPEGTIFYSSDDKHVYVGAT